MGVVCARCQLQMLSARLHAAASDSGVFAREAGSRAVVRASVSGFLGAESDLSMCRAVVWVVARRRCGVGPRLLLGAVSLCVAVTMGEVAFAFVGFVVRSGMGVLCRVPS